MEKAYDFKALLNSIKEELPEIGEESVKVILKKVFPWLQESAVLSETKIDDIVAGGYPFLQTKLEELAENINKEDNV